MERRTALQRIGGGTIVIVLGFLAGTALEYVVKAVLARSLGPQWYGLFTQGLAVLQLLGVVGVLGLHQALPRFIAADRDGERAMAATATAVLLTLATSSLLAAGLYLAAGRIGPLLGLEPGLITVLRLFAPALVPLCLFYLATAMLRGIEDTRYKVLTGDVALPVIEIGLIVVAIRYGLGLQGVIGAYTVAVATATVLAATAFLRLAELQRPDRLIPRELLGFAWPLLGVALITTTNKWIDVLMLGRLTTAAQTGVYEVAMAVAGFLLVFLSSLNYIFMPVATRLAGADQEQLAEVYRASTRWITLLTGPLLLGMLLFPRNVIGLLFGGSYVSGAPALTVLAVGYFIAVAVGPAGMLLVAAGRTRRFLVGSLVLLVVDVVLNLALIPRYGLLGAAVALGTAMAASNAVMLRLARDTVGHRLVPMELTRILTALGLAGLAGLALAATDPGVPGSILYGGLLTLIYAVLLHLLDAVPVEDQELVRAYLT